MFDFQNKANIGKDYKGFYLVKVDDLPEYKAKGVYLRHKNTGLEVYHIVTDDRENLFSFCFRTVAKDSLGTAHIMEHSTLCGSERFPLKEPFTTLENQSVKTFLNAMTYPNRTAYPAASMVRSDYFNLMDVYADAVFFPLLSKETFLQEGHRLELDENGKPSVQGVVYNEMKGSYSSFNSVAIDTVVKTMYPDSYPAFDSGGDPACIPELTYEQFLAFHQKFYNPDNCILFLYGNIPTEQQLDFLNEKFMTRIQEKYGIKENCDISSELPVINPEILQLQKLNFLDKSVEVYDIAPDSGANGSLVTLNWYSGEYSMEKFFLNDLLCGSTISPLTVKLRESGLGEDISPVNGNFGQYDTNFFSIGMSDVKKGNEEKLRKFIIKSINEIYEEGFSQELVDASVMGLDYDFREVVRSSSPYSIVLMSRVSACWSSGIEINRKLHPCKDFEAVKEKLKTNKNYLKELMDKYVMKPMTEGNCAFVVVEPSKEYFKIREENEKQLVKKLEQQVDKEELKKQLELLHKYQQKTETPEELSCIPHLKISDLTERSEKLHSQLKVMKTSPADENCTAEEFPVILSTEQTNGIVYMDIMFPMDQIKPEEYLDIPVFVSTLTDLGWAGKDWKTANTEMACVVRDVWGETSFSREPFDETLIENLKQYEHLNITERDWMYLTTCFLKEFTEPALNSMVEIVNEMDFSDKKHFKELLSEYVSESKSSFVSSGLKHAARRAGYHVGRTELLKELCYGITQLEKLVKCKKAKPEMILKHYAEMYKKITSQGGVIHITADEESMKKVEELLPSFAAKIHMKTPAAGKRPSYEELLPLVTQTTSEEINRENIIVDTQSGYAVMTCPATQGINKDFVAEDVLCHWLSMHTLWDKIRTTGGAYGAHATAGEEKGCVFFSTYRDPKPEESIDLIIDILKEVSEKDISQEEVDCCIISCYSDEISPESPEAKGIRGCNRILFGTENLSDKYLEVLLKTTAEDVKAAAKRIYQNALKKRNEVIFFNKTKKNSSNKLKLPL
ncbi:MAG: insulinase family protein [Treponema sp.]|nr:insulinase family protein [Treponema sp.]